MEDGGFIRGCGGTTLGSSVSEVVGSIAPEPPRDFSREASISSLSSRKVMINHRDPPTPIPIKMKIRMSKMITTCGEVKSSATVESASMQVSSSHPNLQLRIPLQTKSGLIQVASSQSYSV